MLTVSSGQSDGYADPRGRLFTEGDRVPQHAGERFGIRDRTTTCAPAVLLPYADLRHVPRDRARFAALCVDLDEHGIGNPLALFHDTTRAVLAEGAHRLVWALRAEASLVPVRLIQLETLAQVSNFAKAARPIEAALAALLA